MSRIAIIGTGVSGLSAAYLLHEGHDITVYEKAAGIGGHARTLNIRYNGHKTAVDTGFIVFNYKNYPHLSALFDRLKVPVQKSNMTFGISIRNGEIEWGAQSLNALFGQRRNILNPAFWRFLFDIIRFNATVEKKSKANPGITLGALLEKMRMGPWFAPYYILPMGGAIWSCPLQTMLGFPAQNFVDFFKAHGLLTITQQPQWYTVTGGSIEYLRRLTAAFAMRIRLNCGAVSITRDNGKVTVADAQGGIEIYDHVIMACPANIALSLLIDANTEEKETLGAFKYQPNHAVLHKDTSIMPQHKNCWSSWVYHSNGDPAEKDLSVTYWMNQLQDLPAERPLFVTLNPLKPIAPEHIFDEHVFAHPVYSLESTAAQKKMPALQGKRNTWFCGAHHGNGFHEDGIASAVDVAQRMGATIPWL